METAELYQLFLQHPVVTTDTRDCPPDSLFFALRGETFDGNRFADQALKAGCAYAIVDDAEVARTNPHFILVDDTLKALQELARYHRRQLGLPVIQITGTNGKTTTKELVSTVLSEKYKVLFTQGNFNNHIGVPKTLLRLSETDEIAVVESGANHPGEIATLARIIDADYGLITNIGKAHLEGFGSYEGVIRTKGELFDFLRTKQGSRIFLHADNPILQPIAHDLPAYTYGAPAHDFDIEGEVVACNPYLQLRWRKRGDNWHVVQTRLVGAYNLENVLAAAAVGTYFKVSPEQIDHALEHYQPTNHRSELMQTEHNRLIVDAYNANPTSMAAAVENFRLMEHPKKLAILGAMRELGEAEAEEHQSLIDRLHTLSDTEVWLVREEFAPFAGDYRLFADYDDVKRYLEAHPVADHLILIKGSNSNRLYLLPPLL